jgi:hypothetical protein
MFNNLTKRELTAVRSSVRNSIELYKGYVKLRPESPVMARKQGQKRQRLIDLTSALEKLSDKHFL